MVCGVERVEHTCDISGRSCTDEELSGRCVGEHLRGDFEADRGGGESSSIGAGRDGFHAVSRHRM